MSTEFVRYRWYPDAQFGTAYFHDHVDALNSWQHGLFGGLISEPPGSIYVDPRTGLEVKCGPIADIRTNATVTLRRNGVYRGANAWAAASALATAIWVLITDGFFSAGSLVRYLSNR